MRTLYAVDLVALTKCCHSYLGDGIAHIAFPLLLWDTPAFQPLVLLGPLANYGFLRYMGGNKENESSQGEPYEKADNEEKMQDLRKADEEKKSFLAAPGEIKKPWLWTFVRLGAIAVVKRLPDGYKELDLTSMAYQGRYPVSERLEM